MTAASAARHRLSRSSEQSGNAILQLTGPKRLDEVVVDAGLECRAEVAFLRTGGEHDDGHRPRLGMRPQGRTHLYPGETGHHPIEYDKVGMLVDREAQRIGSRHGMQQHIVLAPETAVDERHDIWLILAYQNARQSATPFRSMRASLSPVSLLGQRALPPADTATLGASGLVQRAREFSQPLYLAVIAGLALTTFGLGFAALYLTPTSGTAAIWWPAAGTSALLYLLYRGPRWQVLTLVGAVAVVSNLLIGRPPAFAAWGAIIVVSEIVVFATVLGPQGRTAMLATSRGLLRFIGAALTASVTVGVIGAIAFVMLVDANPLASFASLVPSHLSALLLIVPLALVPLPRRISGQRLELSVQAALTATVAVFVFAPFQSEPIATLLFAFLGWAAVRFRPIVASVELVVLGTVASVLTVFGGGPFAVSAGELPSALLVQIYLLSIALTIQFITVVRSERAELRAENERRAVMLRGGFVGSQVGSLFARAEPGESPTVLEVNDIAASLVDDAWFEPLVDAWLHGGDADLTTDVLLDDGRTVQVYGRRVPTADGDTVLGLQLVDISDFVAAQLAMEDAIERERRVGDELRALAKQKEDFVSAVSHELRTPITSILGFAEELGETATPDQQQSTEIIVRNAHRLTEMVEQLLEIGRMTAPNPLREVRTIDLTEIVRETIDDQSGIALKRNVTIRNQLSADPTLVIASTNTVGRIITNLLSNAIKFSPPGGTVDISTASDGNVATLTIDDSGPGISEIDLPHVFERFFRSDDAQKRLTPGTGLGLSIVRSLVQSHDGDIAISRSPLGGARVVITLPAAFEGMTSIPEGTSRH